MVRLDREFVRDQDTVWVLKNDKLEIRDTEIVFSDAQYAYIRSGLDDGEEVVITTLATVAEGIGLRKTNGTHPPVGALRKQILPTRRRPSERKAQRTARRPAQPIRRQDGQHCRWERSDCLDGP